MKKEDDHYLFVETCAFVSVGFAALVIMMCICTMIVGDSPAARFFIPTLTCIATISFIPVIPSLLKYIVGMFRKHKKYNTYKFK